MFRYGLGLFIAISLVFAGCGNNAIQSESTGVYRGKALDGIANVTWEYEDLQWPQLEASVTEVAAYVGDQYNLHSIDSRTGKKKWMFEVKGRISRPAATDGLVSFLDDDGVHAIDAESGKLLWEHLYKTELPYEMRPTQTTASANHVFVNERLDDGRGVLRALDIKTGKESWNYGNEISLSLTRAPILSGDKLYIASQMSVHILKEKTGKEVDSIEHEAIIDNVATDNRLLVVSDIVGGVTAYDIKSKQLKWTYKNDAFDMKSRPDVNLFGNKLLLTEVKSGIVMLLDTVDGKVLWSKTLGKPVFSTIYGGTITKPVVTEDRIYLAVFDGQHEELKGVAGYSTLLAFDAVTGKELWRYKEEDYIYNTPALIENGMVVVTENGLKAYQGGPNNQDVNHEEPMENVSEIEKTPVELAEELKAFEGHWSTPGSDELAFNLVLSDGTNGIMTFYSEGVENPTQFQYVVSGYNQLMLKLGAEEKPVILRLDDSGELNFTTNEQKYKLNRSGVSQIEEGTLIDGFKGRWCDEYQELCFEIVLDDGENGGYLDYYQEKEPYQEKFRIPYMDEYEIVLEFEAASSQVTLTLDDMKETLTYVSDFRTATMIKQ